jgi:hypothetical protein
MAHPARPALPYEAWNPSERSRAGHDSLGHDGVVQSRAGWPEAIAACSSRDTKPNHLVRTA